MLARLLVQCQHHKPKRAPAQVLDLQQAESRSCMSASLMMDAGRALSRRVGCMRTSRWQQGTAWSKACTGGTGLHIQQAGTKEN